MTVYLASRYQDYPLMREWRLALECAGFHVRARWINGGHEINNDDECCRQFAQEDMEDLFAADIVIVRSDPRFFRSGRGGRHVEFGLALAWKKRIILVGERENVFHWLVECVPTFESAVKRAVDRADA